MRGDRWRVLHVTPYGACAIVEVAGAADSNRGTIARFILPFEPAEPMLSPCDAPKAVRPSTFRRAARAALATATPTWTSLRAPAWCRVTLLPYQLEPALAMTRGLACRFLLADEVGLGKTIQAGLLVAELLERERDARVLIVTPAGLREQWREELRDRFAIEAETLDAAGLARATARLPAGVNPWAVARVILTSIDFIKRPDVIRSLEPLVWDLVAFDEAHGLSGRSDRATAADLLARRGRRVVAITATPHTGDARAFERLCALGALADHDPILLFRRSRADAGIAGGRSMRLLRVQSTPAEQAVHSALDDYARCVWRDAPTGSAAAARLAMIVLARRACSSAASLARSVERRLTLLESGTSADDVQLRLPLGDDLRDDQEPDAELAAPGLEDSDTERRYLERILGLARAATTGESKIAVLARLLRRAAQPAIVFTEYRDTLDRVAAALPFPAAHLHGGLTAAERAHEVRRFTHGDAPLLLATDAASEGLNLHQRCRLVVNLEVPWTPLRLEQRIGRVDRLGQERRVHAIGLLGRGTAEESIIATLRSRTATAAREAPFGGLGDTPPRHLDVVNLRDEAVAEALRLQTCRALAARGSPGVGARPIVAVLRRRRRPRVYQALRLTFVDVEGRAVWNTLVATTAQRSSGPGRSARDLLAWFAGVEADIASEGAAAVLVSHGAILQRLTRELVDATQPLIAREEAILRALHARHGRLAAALIQTGLFDRRTLRDADAQRRVAEEATASAAQRVLALRRLAGPIAGDQQFVFAVAV